MYVRQKRRNPDDGCLNTVSAVVDTAVRYLLQNANQQRHSALNLCVNDRYFDKQEAQLRVIEYFAKSLTVIRNDTIE